MITPGQITPPMTPGRAREFAAGFDLRALPADFLANPYPVYAALREADDELPQVLTAGLLASPAFQWR